MPGHQLTANDRDQAVIILYRLQGLEALIFHQLQRGLQRFPSPGYLFTLVFRRASRELARFRAFPFSSVLHLPARSAALARCRSSRVMSLAVTLPSYCRMARLRMCLSFRRPTLERQQWRTPLWTPSAVASSSCAGRLSGISGRITCKGQPNRASICFINPVFLIAASVLFLSLGRSCSFNNQKRGGFTVCHYMIPYCRLLFKPFGVDFEVSVL